MSTAMITFYETADGVDINLVRLAEERAQQSPDLSTKTGAVIVSRFDERIVSSGFNRMPRGRMFCLTLDERLARPEKYLWIAHSEVVAIGACANYGIPTCGASLYSNWWPCADCTRLIIESGIARVVGVDPDTTHPKYGHEFEVSLQMLKEAGVECCFVGERVQVQK